MPLVLGAVERLLLLRMRMAPAPMLDIFGAFGLRVLAAGDRLGVLDRLDEGDATAAEVARAAGMPADAASTLLRALAALGYVRTDGEVWSLTKTARKWLTGPGAVRPGIVFWDDALAGPLRGFEAALQAGAPAETVWQWFEREPRAGQRFQEYLDAMARLGGDEVVRRMPLPRRAKRLLDIGGGSGAHAIAMCRRRPDLGATVLDLPAAAADARRRIAAAGMADRIDVVAADALRDDLPDGHDAVLMANLVHLFPTETNARLLSKARAALPTGGRIMVLDQFLDTGPRGLPRAIAALLGAAYLGLVGGRTYSAAQLATMLRAAGFGHVRTKTLLRSGAFVHATA